MPLASGAPIASARASDPTSSKTIPRESVGQCRFPSTLPYCNGSLLIPDDSALFPGTVLLTLIQVEVVAALPDWSPASLRSQRVMLRAPIKGPIAEHHDLLTVVLNFYRELSVEHPHQGDHTLRTGHRWLVGPHHHQVVRKETAKLVDTSAVLGGLKLSGRGSDGLTVSGWIWRADGNARSCQERWKENADCHMLHRTSSRNRR